MTLHCYCCGRAYERGRFTCCAPPSGMASHRWLEQWCRVEVSPGKFCSKCPRCGCKHRVAPKVTGLEIGLTTPADLAPKTRGALKDLARKEWTPYQDREPGEDG